MAKLTIMIGIPGSGKSTIASAFGEVVSTDAIRGELFGDEGDQRNGNRVWREAYSRIHALLAEGKDAVLDATNVSAKRRKEEIAEFAEASEIMAVWVDTPIEVAIKRNANRDRKVPYSVIRRMNNQLEIPNLDEGFSTIVKLTP